ncbi:ComEC/Rec2 family competence protein [Arthrobacter sp. ISL-28]|uniref:ComEC/Rec2 family competence protein n=1 Tax=Arthrobacter sp. ISL-28 TaxID=2819108 RepID=UPI002889FCD3|nr:ComEC/Rec2 family competence protein [Arthrobacter sp. ISL-28]
MNPAPNHGTASGARSHRPATDGLSAAWGQAVAPAVRPAPGHRGSGFLRRIREWLGSRLAPDERAIDAADERRRRVDLRLVPSALLVWAAAAAGPWLSPPWLLGMCCALVTGSAVLLVLILRRSGAAPHLGRSFLLTIMAAMLLAVAAAAHSAVSSAQKNDGPVAAAIAARASCLAEVEIAGAPRALKISGGAGLPSRWAVVATIKSLNTGGQLLRADAAVVIMGGEDWQHVASGQRVRTAGKLRPPDPGQLEAGILSASSSPITLRAADAWTSGPAALGSQFAAAAGWLDADARGLLPGMVTGDTSGLDEQLEMSMQTVGLTHLTAVSGANCGLILGALLLAARSLRLARLPAAAFALAGLGLFVLMVGPDASVLRAALMGAIALASLASGRTGRGLSFLCLAVIGLLLIDPGLGTSFGFLLSVLATLGIIALGRQIVDWIPDVIPRWAAAGIAVPLSAQLLCGPVVVLLQPQFAAFSLPANILAAPLVAPVTILGTAAVPLVPLLPWLAAVLIGVAGFFTAGVAGVARFVAALPGASLPWPEGVLGLLTMVMLSALTIGIVWMAVRPRQILRLVVALHGRTEGFLERAEQHVRGYRTALRPDRPRHGLEPQADRGWLRYCTNSSRRNPESPLRQPLEPGQRRPTRPPGGT